jgi:hypothetical protein
MHVYEVRPRKDHRGVDPISDVLPFGRLWYGEPSAISNAIGYAIHRSRSHGAVIPRKNCPQAAAVTVPWLLPCHPL